MKLPNPVLLAYLAAGGAGIFIAWRLSKVAGKAADALSNGASAAADLATGAWDPVGDAIGWHFYAGTEGWRLGDASGSLNPASDTNPVYSAVSAAGEAVTGTKGWNLGGWIYDITHPEPAASDKANYATTDGYNYGGIWGF